jgi:hypothetical protein
MATLVPCLVRLRSEFNAVASGRDKSSDGWIGDPAHQANPTSDHNPDGRGLVHAIDVDVDLREPGLSMEKAVQFLLGRCRSGAEKRLRYIIFNRRIWSASNGWRQEAYTGANAHDKHAHFSASYSTSLEASTASWHLEDLEMALTEEQTRAAIRAELESFADRAPLTDIHARTGFLANQWAPAVNARLTTLASADDVDEAAIVAGVLAGLNPAAIAAAIPLDIAERVADELRDRLAG